MFQEIAGPGSALHFTFGSYQQQVEMPDKAAFFRDMAKIIVHTMESNHVLRAKTFYRQHYRWEAVWSQIEQAILTETVRK